ncbi:MAG: hypothetical protein KAH31_10530, partial [Candidatus Sabulitectum sp.]|nr:hypothetical protein [Candidatus Sabulitectum sp.]
LKGLWRLDRVSQRTIFWFNATIGNKPIPKSEKSFRNPVIQAKEIKLEMELNDLTRADLARKLGISRARVTQMLNLLKLPEDLKEEIEAMGDYWERRLVTERMLRSRLV